MRSWCACMMLLGGCLSSPNPAEIDGAVLSYDADPGALDASADAAPDDVDAFDGANGHLRLTASSMSSASISDAVHSGLDLTGDFTFETWVRFDTLPADGEWAGIIGKTDFGASQTAYSFAIHRVGSGVQIHLRVDGNDDAGGGRGEARWDWSPSTGVWYHLAATYDISQTTADEEMIVYVDGAQLGVPTETHPADSSLLNDSVAPFVLGAMTGLPDTYLDGRLDDVRVWNVKRSGVDIDADRARKLSGSEAGLVAYGPFDPTSEDATVRNNDLTLNDGASIASGSAF